MDFRFDLLRHLAILEGKKNRLFDLPIRDQEVLDLFTTGAAEPSAIPSEEITDESLISSLQLCYDSSIENSNVWLWRATRQNKAQAFEASALVEKFTSRTHMFWNTCMGCHHSACSRFASG